MHCVPRFHLSIEKSLRFTTFNIGMKVYISFLSKNRIETLSSWLSLNETVMYLHRLEETPKVMERLATIILHQQIKLMAPVMASVTIMTQKQLLCVRSNI